MTSVKCPKCGQELTGNGKNCINCNTKDGHKLIRETKKDLFNSFFHERHRSDCKSYALISVMISLIILGIVVYILAFLFPTVTILIDNLGVKTIIVPPIVGLIIYPLAFHYKKNSLLKEFVASQFKGDSK
jgi:hypothetical protein